MDTFTLAKERASDNRPINVGIIGAGKFASMFLNQVPHMAGLEVRAIADLSVERAKSACRVAGWTDERISATEFLEDGSTLAVHDALDVVIEATGDPEAGLTHADTAISHGKHVVMVNVEADVLAGAALAKRAKAAGVVYTMAYGDQPALVAELIDWARACGFSVVAAGKGTKYLPHYHSVTPDDVWTHYGLSPDAAAKAGMNPQMFNSFLDGTKSAIEMCAIANACGLEVPDDGLAFPPCGVDDLAHILRPQAVGGVLEKSGVAEVVSSLERDGRPVYRDLRWGVYVVFEAPNDYAQACFAQYGVKTDESGRYAALYRPYHMIGLELGISVYQAALKGTATGVTRAFSADTVAVAKRDLSAGDLLDGEGGYTVWGKAIPAARSLASAALPIGLSKGVTLQKPVRKGQIVSKADIRPGAESRALKIRQEAETLLGQ
ncbi:MAG: Gfo/Idh/MocA family oxidoreductase [Pseudomonadota bacterium]